MIFLGVEVNSLTMTLRIPEEKWKEIQELLVSWQEKNRATLKDVQKLTGSLNFVCKCVKSGWIYLSRILNFLRTLPKFGSKTIPVSVKKDINWWVEFTPRFNDVSLITDNWWSSPDEVLSTDSCLSGGGAFFNGNYCHWEFPPQILHNNWDINQLECIMIVMACKMWGHALERKKLVIFCDNQVTVTAVNSSTSRNTVIQACLRELHCDMALHSFKLKTVYLEGSKYRISDALSRFHKSKRYRETFWKLVQG